MTLAVDRAVKPQHKQISISFQFIPFHSYLVQVLHTAVYADVTHYGKHLVAIIGMKHDFPFINIRKVLREVLKAGGEARVFNISRGTLRMLMNDKNMFDRFYCINSKKTHRKLRKCLCTLFFSLTTIFLRAHAFYKYCRFGPGPGTFSHDDLKA